MITADSPERVAAVLEPLRGIADEVVLAVDSRVDAATVARFSALADRVLRIEFLLVERHLPWLHAQCGGDWILKLDGDEVPSAAFVRRLPGLLASRSIVQYWIARAWVHPDPGSVLDELPWSVDFNNRLVRNVGTLWFEGVQHAHAAPAHPAAYVEEPVYHLELLTETAEARRAKAIRYEVARPHMVAHGGGRVNEAFYLPELRTRVRTRPVPAEDRDLLRRALTPPPLRGPAPPSVPELPVVALTELDREWIGRVFPPSTYASRIEPYAALERLPPQRTERVLVRVTNLGTETLPGLPVPDPPIRLSYRWLGRDGSVLVADGERTFLPARLGPGESALVPMTVRTPERGAYVLEIDLVHEGVRWFGCPLRIALDVGEPQGVPPVGPRLQVTRAPRLRRLRRRRIPRILHRVSLGEEGRGFGDSWARLHEGWTLRTWTGAELAELGLAEFATRVRVPSELSDAVRFEVLRRYGGVCVDAAVECRRPIDPLLRGISAFAVLERPGRVGTAMLGSVPDHPAFARAAREAPRMLGLGAHTAGAGSSYFLSLLLEQEGGVAILGLPSVLGTAAEPRRARRDAPVAVHDLA
jgi:hypothetical protein